MTLPKLPPPPKFNPSIDGWLTRLWQKVQELAAIPASLISFTATQRVLGRNTSGAGAGEEVTASQILDWIGSTRGSILYRGASGWAILAPGTDGYVLTSGGAGADPAYEIITGTTWQQNKSHVELGETLTISAGLEMVLCSGFQVTGSLVVSGKITIVG